jgi:hypothetical protein
MHFGYGRCAVAFDRDMPLDLLAALVDTVGMFRRRHDLLGEADAGQEQQGDKSACLTCNPTTHDSFSWKWVFGPGFFGAGPGNDVERAAMRWIFARNGMCVKQPPQGIALG